MLRLERSSRITQTSDKNRHRLDGADRTRQRQSCRVNDRLPVIENTVSCIGNRLALGKKIQFFIWFFLISTRLISCRMQHERT